jgi:cytochrome oxidase Cu insertion factor (SCO1/SenC/PrrC family)
MSLKEMMNKMNSYYNIETTTKATLRVPHNFMQITVSLCFVCLFILSASSFVMSQEKKAKDNTQETVTKNTSSLQVPRKVVLNHTDKAKKMIPDLTVQTQDNQTYKFYTDLVKGKLVIINFIYTSCAAICPLSGETFTKLQTALGDRLGKDVFLITITTDPEIDSVQKLKTWSEKFKPKNGWTFVTGEKSAMTSLLNALSGEGPRKGYHTPQILMVNDNEDSWITAYGLDSPANLLNALERLNNPAKRTKKVVMIKPEKKNIANPMSN